jgi:thioredoxin 1
MASEFLQEFTAANWQQSVLEAATPVLVDFWAPWCTHCRPIAPLVDAIAAENAGKLVVGKLNTDNDGQIAENYNIQGIPALLLFKNGEIAERLTGGQHTKANIQAMVDRHL